MYKNILFVFQVSTAFKDYIREWVTIVCLFYLLLFD